MCGWMGEWEFLDFLGKPPNHTITGAFAWGSQGKEEGRQGNTVSIIKPAT